MKRKRGNNKPVPLAPPVLKSRKQARKVTTRFHRLTRERDEAESVGDVGRATMLEQAIADMGGRAEYQRASQVSTSYFSTSKWVLGYLARNGWLYGRRTADSTTNERRSTAVLEVGAINTELLDAASKVRHSSSVGEDSLKYKLAVRAIDLHSMHQGIEEADFLTIPLPREVEDRYDVVVCSMVINCVTTPSKRGEMLARLYHALMPDGLCFLTLPKSCLSLSPYMNRPAFRLALEAVGLEVLETKESPKIAFFICHRPCKSPEHSASLEKLSKLNAAIYKHQKSKAQSDFSLELTAEMICGSILTYID